VNKVQPCTSFFIFGVYGKVEEKRWQNEKQSLCVRSADMSLPSGWENVQAADNGIRWLKRLK